MIALSPVLSPSSSSSYTIGSLRFHFHKGKKFAAHFKIVVSLVLKNFVPLK